MEYNADVFEKIVDKIWSLFINRADVYAVQQPDGTYRRVSGELTREHIRRHLRGEITLGLYATSQESFARWICFDFDGDDGPAEASKLLDYLLSKNAYRDSVMLEDTGGRGGKGRHLWIFFTSTPAKHLKWLAQQLLKKAGVTCEVEIFPKTVEITPDSPYGSLVRLPLGIHRKTGSWSKMLYPQTVEDFLNIQPVTIPENILKQIEDEISRGEMENVETAAPTNVKPVSKPWWVKCAVYQRIKEGVEEGCRNEALFFLSRTYRDAGLTFEEAMKLLLDWNKKNNPPLPEKELKDVVKRVFKKGYAPGFRFIRESNLAKFCPEGCDLCPYAREEKALAESPAAVAVGEGVFAANMDLQDASLTLTPDGWRITYNNKIALIFDNILLPEVDEEIARQLGIDVGRARILKHRLLSAWFPRSLDEYRLLFPTIKGEDNNVKALILAWFSHKLRNWKDRIQAVILQGANSSGKSHLARATVVEPFKTYVQQAPAKRADENGEVSANEEIVYEVTDITLSYFKRKFANINFDRKILFLQQSESLGLELALMVSETGLTFCYSEFQDGKWVPVEAKITGHPLIICTAVNFRGPPDWDHRFLTLFTDESPELTIQVMDFAAKQAMDFVFKEKLARFQEGCWAVLRMIWQLIPENLDVVVPYADLLRQSIKFDLESTKPRRDFLKLLALIYASAILHYPFRPKIQHNGRVILVATEEDLKELLPVLGQVLKQTTTGLSKKHEQIINFLRKWKEERKTAPVMTWPTAREIAEGLGMNSSTLRSHYLPHLIRKGYIFVEKEGRANRYALVKEPVFGIDEQVLEQCAERVKAFLSPHPPDQMISSEGGGKPAQIGLIPGKNGSDQSAQTADQQMIRSSAQLQLGSDDQPVEQFDQFEKPALQGVESRNSTPHTSDHLITGVEGEARQAIPPEASPVARVMEEPPLKYSGPVCEDCVYWHALRCEKHPDWIVVTPTARYPRNCEYFVSREVKDRDG
jgi:sulfur relay (sulfurtransferase) DsrC/TusE family protein